MYTMIRRVVVAAGTALALLVPAAAANAASTAGPPALSWQESGTAVSSYSYGTVNAGTAHAQTFVLANFGGSASPALTITLAAGSSPAFSKTADACTGTSLRPGKSCRVTITYAPAASGQDDQATLTAGGNSAATLALSGASKAAPTIATAPQPLTAVAGTPVADLAILVGGFTPTGTITFSLYKAPDCTKRAFSAAVPVSGQGQYLSASFTPAKAGTYYWVARYSGDGSNAPAASGCADEKVTVVLGYPTIATAPQPLTAVAGTPVADLAILVGGFTPTGTITFSLYKAPDCTKRAFSAAVPVSGQGQYLSASFTPAKAGTYYWVARYSGDGSNAPAASGCADEQVTITS